MLALIAAIVFLIALLFDWTSTSIGTVLTPGTLELIGLILLALHFAPVTEKYIRRRRR